MQLDVLNLVAGDPAWRVANGLNMLDHTMWTYMDTKQLVYIKGPNGYPWDWYFWDETYIYLFMTELTWGNPHSAKVNYYMGVPRGPRYIDYSPDQSAPAAKSFPVDRPRTDYLLLDATQNPQASSNAHVVCKFYGPVPGPDIKDSKGNVIIPAGNDWLWDYTRNNGTVTERLYHRSPVGRYRWEQRDSSGNITTFSMVQGIVNQPCPAPVQYIF